MISCHTNVKKNSQTSAFQVQLDNGHDVNSNRIRKILLRLDKDRIEAQKAECLSTGSTDLYMPLSDWIDIYI